MKRLGILLVFVCIIVLAGTLLGVFVSGVFGTDFTGGYILKVSYEDDITENDYTKLKSDLTKIANDVGLKTSSFVSVALAGDLRGVELIFSPVVNGKKLNDEAFVTLANTVETAALMAAEAASETAIDEVVFNRLGPSEGSINLALWSLLSAGIGLVIAAIYCGVRFFAFGNKKSKLLNGLRCALSLVLNTVVVLVLAFALSIIFAVIFSVPLQNAFSISLLIAVFGSIATAMFTLNSMHKLNESDVTENLSGVTTKKLLLPFGAVVAVLVVTAVLLGFLGTTTAASFAVTAVAGIIAAVFVAVFLLPHFWNMFKFGRLPDIKTKQSKDGES